jgi:hypothetical protein
MSKPTIAIHNIETNELIEREMNDAEIKLYNARVVKEEAQKAKAEAEAEAKATQKAALLERLGITEAEARLLLG